MLGQLYAVSFARSTRITGTAHRRGVARKQSARRASRARACLLPAATDKLSSEFLPKRILA
jgi:hypothetical protein